MDFTVFHMFEYITQIILLITAVSVDSFAASLAYGIKKVEIPLSSLFILSAISGGTLAASMCAGSFLCGLIPAALTKSLGAILLFGLGLFKLFDRSCDDQAQRANRNNDKLLTPAEAASLGIALSLDSIAAGLGVGFPLYALLAATAGSFFVSIAAILLGSYLGRKIACRSCKNFCWFGGVLLILLALCKLF